MSGQNAMRELHGSQPAGRHLDDEILSAYIDGALSPQEIAAVSRHLAECSFCAQRTRLLQQTVGLLKALPQVAAPRSFVLREADIAPRRAGPAGLFVFLRAATAAVAVLLVLLVAGDFVLHSALPAPSSAPAGVTLRQANAPQDATMIAQAEKAPGPITPAVERTVLAEAPAVEPSPTPAATRLAMAAPTQTPTVASAGEATAVPPAAAAAKELAPAAPQPTAQGLAAVPAPPQPAATPTPAGAALPTPTATIANQIATSDLVRSPTPSTEAGSETATAVAAAKAAPFGKGGGLEANAAVTVLPPTTLPPALPTPTATLEPTATPTQPPTATATTEPATPTPLPPTPTRPPRPSPTSAPATAVAQSKPPLATLAPVEPATQTATNYTLVFRAAEAALLLIALALAGLTLASRRR